MNLLRPIDRILTVNGARLHALDWGGEGRPPLLLLHGFTGHAHAWDTLSIALQPHFHVYALDQRGHGDSDPADTYNPIVAGDDIAGVVSYEDIVFGIKRIIGAGHINLVETLAEQVAKLCLSDSRVSAARIRIEKLDVFREAGSVGVEIERRSGRR